MIASHRFIMAVMFLATIFSSSYAFLPSSARNALSRTMSSAVWGASKRTCTSIFMSNTVIEKPLTRTVGPAILERPVEERTIDETVKESNKGSQAWEVRIYNDGLNTREHVARSLVQVTSLSELEAYQTMMQAHQNGIAVVGRYFYEIAEMYNEALRKKGIVCDIIPVEEE